MASKSCTWIDTTQIPRQPSIRAQELHTLGILIRNKWRNKSSPCEPLCDQCQHKELNREPHGFHWKFLSPNHDLGKF